MQVANSIRLCGFNLDRALTKTVNLCLCQADSMRCVINSDDVTSDNRVINLVIQVGKVVNRTRIGAIVNVKEASDVIDSIVSIIAVQKRIKCCDLCTNLSAQLDSRTTVARVKCRVRGRQEVTKSGCSLRNVSLKALGI